MTWQPGSAIALREVLEGRIWTAYPATVVEDGPGRTMLWIPPGVRWKLPADPDTGEVLRSPWRDWTLADAEWLENRVLSFAWPGLAHAVLLFWDGETGEFRGWYVNLQSPLQRTRIGFDYMDDVLDIVVAADRTWHWKDEAELAERVQRGLWAPQRAAAIRAEGERAIERLRAREEPFDEAWITWRPDPSWPIPELPTGWDAV